MRRILFLTLGALLAACGPAGADPAVVAKAVESTLQAQVATAGGDTMATAVAATLGPPTDTPPAATDTALPTEPTSPVPGSQDAEFLPAGSAAWVDFASEETIEPFADFVLSFPGTWRLVVEKTFIPTFDVMHESAGPLVPIVEMELRNGSYVIRISRPGLGLEAAGCLYPEDPSREGMYISYGEYRELQKPGGIVWRRAEAKGMPQEGWSVSVCQRREESGRFIGFTSVGFLSLVGPRPDERALREFDAILDTLVVKE